MKKTSQKGKMLMNQKEEFDKESIFGLGKENVDFAKYFIGKSQLNSLTNPKETVFLANITFEPACRNNWHIYHATKGGRQILVCTAGYGWYQEEGKEAVSLAPGMELKKIHALVIQLLKYLVKLHLMNGVNQ